MPFKTYKRAQFKNRTKCLKDFFYLEQFNFSYNNNFVISVSTKLMLAHLVRTLKFRVQISAENLRNSLTDMILLIDFKIST